VVQSEWRNNLKPYENKMVQAFRLVLRSRVSSGRNCMRARHRILSYRFFGGGQAFSFRKRYTIRHIPVLRLRLFTG
jgi:hypothetical protein